MKVAPAKRPPQHKKATGIESPPIELHHKTFPAPIRGWVMNENLSDSPGKSALQLDNWFPTSRSIRLRGGTPKYATLDDAVTSMFTYNGGASEKFFAATAADIFDVTTVADPDVAPTADVTGQTSGYYSTTMFSTAGGDYLYAVNGEDSPQLFDGSAWQAVTGVSAPIAITGVTTSTLSYVWAFASRLFFVESGTQTVWYLPVDSLGGAAASFSLSGVFKNGGSVLFGATWSMDAGDGLDDKCVFVSTLGEVAVYEGTNPSSAADWRKVGVYNLTPPMGMNCHMQAGGDLLIGCQTGIIPLSQAVNKDPAALSLSAISRAIEPEWVLQSQARNIYPWEILKWPAANMMVVSQPDTTGALDQNILVANMETGAWCRFTNVDARCLCLFDNGGYFGTGSNTIHRMENGGTDDGTPFTGVCVLSFDHLDAPGLTKTVLQSRALFKSNHEIRPKVSASTDYDINVPSAPSSGADFTTSEWDSALWDVATWDGDVTYAIKAKWASIGKTGHTIAPVVQVTSGVTPFPRVELISLDFTYTLGAVVT